MVVHKYIDLGGEDGWLIERLPTGDWRWLAWAPHVQRDGESFGQMAAIAYARRAHRELKQVVRVQRTLEASPA